MRSPRFQTSDIPGLHWGDSDERGDNPKLSVAPYVWNKSEQISQCDWAGRGADQNRHHMVTGKNEEQIRTDILWWHGRKRGRSKQTSHGEREGRGADQNTHHIIFRLLLSTWTQEPDLNYFSLIQTTRNRTWTASTSLALHVDRPYIISPICGLPIHH